MTSDLNLRSKFTFPSPLPNINVIKFVFIFVNYELILVRYGEIALKGKVTRKRFENILITNIKNALESKNVFFKIKKEWGRIYVFTSQVDKCIKILKKIFGITSVSPSIQTKSDIDSILKLNVEASKENLTKEKSFAIRVTRIGKHEFTSQDVAIKVGNAVIKATRASVNLTNPDFKFFIEIRNDKAFLFTEKIRCIGGMPQGTQGSVLALIDKPESVLAAWYLIRRGCKVIFLNTIESNKDILKEFMDYWFIKSDILTIVVNDDLYTKINHIAIERNCNAFVTAHTLIYNPKKALSEIIELKKHVNLPILHPLIAMNKEEINKKYKDIGLPI